MKRRGILLVIGIWLSMLVGSGKMPVLAEEQGKPTELIVLVDTSLSLDKEAMNQEIQWMQKICSVSLETGIHVNFLTFDEPQAGGTGTARQLLERTEITGENLNSSLEAISKISHSGRYTDLKGALDDAVAILEGIEGGRRYIMILSDGRLDYDQNRNKDILGTEAPARMEFCEEVKAFAGQQGCGVILVEFGGGAIFETADGDDANDADSDTSWFDREINLFRELEEAEGVFYFQGESALSDAGSSIFQKMGYPIDAIAALEQGDGTIVFTLDQNYDYTIIHLIQKTQNTGKRIAKEDFQILYENQERTIDQIELLPNSAFAFLAESRKGRYTIDFSEGRGNEWNYEVICRKKERVDAIHLSVRQDKTESSEEFYIGNIILHMKMEGDLDAASNPLLSYRLKYEDQDFGDSRPLLSPDIREQGSLQEKAIFIEAAGSYQIQVFGPDESVSSNIVSFTVSDQEKRQGDEPEKVSKNAIVGQEIALRRMFNFQENERVTISMEGEESVHNINEEIANDVYTMKEGSLTFKAAEGCVTIIRGEEKSYEVTWSVTDSDEDALNPLEWLLNKILEFFKKLMDFFG